MEKINNNYYFVNPEIKNNNKTEKKKPIKGKTESLFGSLFTEKIEEEEEINTESDKIDNNNLQVKIASMLKDIGQQGRTLKRNQTLYELDKYKKMVRDFLRKVVTYAEETEVKTIYNAKRKEKVSKLHLKIIDNELLELTRIFIEEQQSVIKLGSQIDKIEGILLDLAS